MLLRNRELDSSQPQPLGTDQVGDGCMRPCHVHQERRHRGHQVRGDDGGLLSPVLGIYPMNQGYKAMPFRGDYHRVVEVCHP
ncbi:hypothetical protein ACPA9J_15655 [Pseudomonas aeruginosa]